MNEDTSVMTGFLIEFTLEQEEAFRKFMLKQKFPQEVVDLYFESLKEDK